MSSRSKIAPWSVRQGARGLTPSEASLAHAVKAKLDQHYAGHKWGIQIAPGGTIVIRNLGLRHPKYGENIAMVIHFHELDPDLKIVMRRAGQFLERFGVPRGHMNGSMIIRPSEADMALDVR